MSNVSKNTTMVALRLPNKLLARVDAAEGSRTFVIASLIESHLPALPDEVSKPTDKAA